MKFLQKASRGLALGLSLIFCFIACQAGQQKSQKQTPANETAAAAPQAAAASTDTAKASVGVNNKIIVYYFHGNARCPTCFKLEIFAKSEVESDFSDAIKNGKLAWKTVNVEEKGNEHFVKDYALYTKSVIVSAISDDKELSWKNLDRIWQLVQEESKYREYIRNEVSACLQGKCL